MKVMKEASNDKVFDRIEKKVTEAGFKIVKQDRSRPWGGFFVIDELQAPLFVKTYFPQFSMKDFEGFNKLSPKFLIVAPHKRRKWYCHDSR